jgi:hypothetical protein
MRLCPKGDSGLELRVDLDGFSPETRDPIRGPGTFKRFLRESNFCPRTPPFYSLAIECTDRWLGLEPRANSRLVKKDAALFGGALGKGTFIAGLAFQWWSLRCPCKTAWINHQGRYAEERSNKVKPARTTS